MFVNEISRKMSRGCLWLAAITLCGCGGSTSETLPTASLDTTPKQESAAGSGASKQVSIAPTLDSTAAAEPEAPRPEPFPEVTIVTSMGDIQLRLNSEKASETVDNFLYNYVDRGFYADTVFHFVQGDFIAIAGGYTADLTPKEAKTPIRNEAGNGLKNVRGTVAMSRHPEYADSATSQFYFNLGDNPSLDQTDTDTGETFGYCVFGEVIEGMDVLQKIAQAEVHDSGDFTNVPVDPIVIRSVRRDK